MFPNYRQQRFFNWCAAGFFLLLRGLTISTVVDFLNSNYFILSTIDLLIWSLLAAASLEVFYVLFDTWGKIPRTQVENYVTIWGKFWKEALNFGFWLTLLAGFTYYCLVSFFIVDTIFYSYLLLLAVMAGGGGLFAVIFCRIKGWIDTDLFQLDREIGLYLKWRELDPAAIAEISPRFHYLLGLRQYLLKFRQPVFSGKTIFLYLLFAGFILLLPYFFGAVIEV